MDPEAAVLRALADAPLSARIWIVSAGKAAVPMARGALAWLARDGRRPAGGVVIGASTPAAADLPLTCIAGDHPLPGNASLAAAEAIASVVAGVRAGDSVWVLLSGGSSSLIAAPVPGVPHAALRALFATLAGAGMDIATMNAARRRFLRWGGGRLAVALSHADVRVLAISDVPGDDPSTIGSGPCTPDPLTAQEVQRLLASVDPEADMAGIFDYLARVSAGIEPETPKPGSVPVPPHTIVLRNADALRAAASEARACGLTPVNAGMLEGEASNAGREIGARVAALHPGACLLWGGETIVSLGGTVGRGGRSQELALAAAAAMAGSPAALLAAGTDGRDGPTDAAGAVVDGATHAAMVGVGVDPDAALNGHDAYTALDAAHALFRPGLTGTNVMDLVIGVRAK